VFAPNVTFSWLGPFPEAWIM